VVERWGVLKGGCVAVFAGQSKNHPDSVVVLHFRLLLNKLPFRTVIINKSNQPFLARKIHFANDIDLCVF
jgi:hypothetical protein